MDDLDRAVIDALQDGMAVCEHPFAAEAEALGVEEAVLIERLRRLLADGVLTRFGPMYDAERLGGAVTLAAMRVPPEQLDVVAADVNAFEEVAHNYEREHELNLWFVLATETPAAIRAGPRSDRVANRIPVYDMPKLGGVLHRAQAARIDAPSPRAAMRSADRRRTRRSGVDDERACRRPTTRGRPSRRDGPRHRRRHPGRTAAGSPTLPCDRRGARPRSGRGHAAPATHAQYRRDPAHRRGAEPLRPRLPRQRHVGVGRR